METATDTTIINIGPQEGRQAEFQGCPADIAIYGGSAGGGKSVALLLEPLRHRDNGAFGAVLFRRTYPQITDEGQLWDISETIYPFTGAEPNRSNLTWTWPSGMTVSFRHMATEAHRLGWLGGQICLLEFDELVTFTEKQFWFMFSRNRSTCGVRPYIRASTNPDADSWVSKLISWWWNPKTGYPIPERAGVVRYFVRVGDLLEWGNTREELIEKHPGLLPKSLTFIPSSVYDNKILMENDPNYLSNLLSLPTVDRERFLKGNWLIRPSAGLYWKREWFKVISKSEVPKSCHNNRIRYWDRAATEKRADNDPDFTAGVRMSRDEVGNYYVEDLKHMQESPGRVQTAITNTARQDGSHVTVYLEQDPAQAGKVEMMHLLAALHGFTAVPVPYTKKKEMDHVASITHAKHASSCSENGFKMGKPIMIVEADWNEAFFHEIEAFPAGAHDDIVRSFGGCMNAFRDSKFQAESVHLPVVAPEFRELRRQKGLIW